MSETENTSHVFTAGYPPLAAEPLLGLATIGQRWALSLNSAPIMARMLAHLEPDHADPDPEASRHRAAEPGARPQAADGSEIAVIALRGLITPRTTWASWGLSYFRDELRQAVADGNVSAIVLDIDSPGGLIDLVPETAAEVRAARATKQIVAVCNTTCASAAYWIASSANKVVITPSGEAGSIGVFLIHTDWSKMDERIGVKTTIISAGQYKTDGNPYEPLSSTAKAAFQAEVDQLYAMFTADVAEGRGTQQKVVQGGYGRGRSLLAQDAVNQGLCDEIATLEQTIANLGGRVEDDEEPEEPDVDEPPDDDDDDDFAEKSADEPSPPAGEQQDVSAPSVDYLSPPAPTGVLI